MTERNTKIHFLEEPEPLELDNMTLSVAKLEVCVTQTLIEVDTELPWT